jgi:DNA-directed RNA polymerase specialized sigma54-like protein
MALYDEMTSNEKYAISNLMDGIVTFIREAKYQPSDEEIIATMIKLYNEKGYLEIDTLIELIK